MIRNFICVKISDESAEDGAREVQLPAVWEICDKCRGNGSHSLAIGAITADEWNGPDWSEEEKEDYLNGAYDQECEDCKGSGKVQIPDEDKCVTDDHKAALKSLQDDAEYEAECQAERRQMERMAGYY